MELPPPPSSKRAHRKGPLGTLAGEPVRSHSGVFSVPSAQVPQSTSPPHPNRSSSVSVMAPQRARGATTIGLQQPRLPVSVNERPSVIDAFSTPVATPILSFTSHSNAIEATEEGGAEPEDDVEWQWGAPAASTTDLVGDTSSSTSNTADMLVDLNSAFAKAFGSVDSPQVQRRGHSRGLSTVFVSPAPVRIQPVETAAVVEGAEEEVSSPAPVRAGQSNVRDRTSPRSLVASKAGLSADRARRQEKREKVVRELLSSEKVYVESLAKLIDLFYRPLTGRPEGGGGGTTPMLSRSSAMVTSPTSSSSLLSKADADALFGQVEVIMLYNTRLYDDLKQRLCDKSYDPAKTQFSDIFQRMQSFLQVYVGYSENYSKAMKTYEVVMSRNTKTRKAVKEAERKAGNIMEAFLILPIQRIPRYILLLKQIIEFTDEGHPDYEPLRETVESIKKLCAAINEAPRKLQEANEMLRVYKSIIPSLPDLLSAGRVFVSQERVWLINAEGIVKPRILFIFNDLLLLARQQERHHYLRFRIALPNVAVHDSPPRELDGKQAFIVTLEASKGKMIVFALKDEEKKASILADIARNNPTIMAGTPAFVPLSERKPVASDVPSSDGDSAGSPAGAVATEVSPRRGSVAPPLVSDSSSSSVLASLSGLLSRKATRTSAAPQGGSSTPSTGRLMVSGSSSKVGKRRESARPAEVEFEIVREETGSTKKLSVSPRAPASEPMTNESADHQRISELRRVMNVKRGEQEGLHRLVAFHQKYNDTQGEAEARANIAKYEEEIAELQKEISAIIQGKKVEASGVHQPSVTDSPTHSRVSKVASEGRRKHTRQRSLSTTSLPKFTSPNMVSDEQSVVVVAAPVLVKSKPVNPFEDIIADASPASSTAATSAGNPFVSAAAPVEVQLVVGCTCVALHDFTGANSGELSFRAGDRLRLVSMEGGGDWYLGQLEGISGAKGWFPAVGYVKPIAK